MEHIPGYDAWFQSTFPQGERLGRVLREEGIRMFQSTFPQGERRLRSSRTSQKRGVSIHVPARGTTTGEFYKTGANAGFQSTFPQGERRRVNLTVLELYSRFNPRSRKGNDQFFKIHAGFHRSFNPRSRKGNDAGGQILTSLTLGFNPRSRKGNDRVFPAVRG